MDISVYDGVPQLPNSPTMEEIHAFFENKWETATKEQQDEIINNIVQGVLNNESILKFTSLYGKYNSELFWKVFVHITVHIATYEP